MNQKSPLLIVIALAGISCLLLGAYILSRPNATEGQLANNSPKITIPFTSYTNNHWDNRGATVENKNGVPINVWMANAGSIQYNFDLPKLPEGSGDVSVLMCSELLVPEEQFNDPSLTSDVTLAVNGKEVGTQNVIKDTGQNNQRYNWNVPISSFQKGQNSIEFQVKKDAVHKHGITISSPITVEFK